MATGYLGTTLGTPISNYIFDSTGSYRLSYVICAITAALTLLLFVLALIKKNAKQN